MRTSVHVLPPWCTPSRTGHGPLLVCLLVLATVALTMVRQVSPAPAVGASRPLAPKTGALLGAYVPPLPNTPGTLDALERALGGRLAINMHFYNFTDPFPTALEQADRVAHRIPMVTWQPGEMSFQRIASGEHDELVRIRAREVRAFGAPLFLRWAPEMNSDGYPRPDPLTTAPDAYVAAWRHLHEIFEQEGVRNVAWVWCPNHVDVPATRVHHWTNFYPGNRYVDWVGVDGFNSGPASPGGWPGLLELVQGVYDDYADQKPIMIAETGSIDDRGSRARWLDEARVLLKDRLPAVKAFVYFNKPSPYALDGSPSSLAAFRGFLLDPYFARPSTGSAWEPPR